MINKVIDLPRKYDYKEGESRPEYMKFNGWNKVSYSQITSFLSDDYRGDYIIGYFEGIRDEGNIFSYFGSACGDYLNRKDQRIDDYLDDFDKAVIDAIKLPEHADFEFEILIDLEPFGLEKTVLQGFSDVQWLEEGLTNIQDAKTLNLDKKKDFYGSDDYQQLNTYGYGLEKLGHKIGRTSVIGLGRKGNALDRGAKYPIRLSGVVEEIDRPYDKAEAENYIKKIAETCIKIDEYYSVWKKYFSQNK